MSAVQETWVQSLGGEDPLEKEMATAPVFQNSSIPENPVDIGAWQATVHGVSRESDMTERLNNNNYYHHFCDHGHIT